MGFAMSHYLLHEGSCQPVKSEFTHYNMNNYLQKPYYFNNHPDEEIKKKLIEKEIWGKYFSKYNHEIDDTMNFIILLNEKDIVGQINKLKETTALDLDNLIVKHDGNSYLIKIPVKDLEDVFVELVV